jgi:biotin-(acetyl-CoA carboxylase) ligase
MGHLIDKAGYRAAEMVERWLEGARLFGETITVERNGKAEKVVPLWIVPDTGELLVKETDGSESVISSADYID